MCKDTAFAPFETHRLWWAAFSVIMAHDRFGSLGRHDLVLRLFEVFILLSCVYDHIFP